MTGHFDSSSLVAQIAQAAERWARADIACDELIDQSISLGMHKRSLVASGRAMDADLISIIGDIEAEIAAVDERIALACKAVTEREAEWKLLARRMIEQ